MSQLIKRKLYNKQVKIFVVYLSIMYIVYGHFTINPLLHMQLVCGIATFMTTKF